MPRYNGTHYARNPAPGTGAFTTNLPPSMPTKQKKTTKGGATKSRGRTSSTGRTKAKSHVAKVTKRGKRTTITRINPAARGVRDLVVAGGSVMGGEIVAGLASAQVARLTPASMDSRTRGLVGVAAGAGLALLALRQKNPTVQMMGVGAASSAVRSFLKTLNVGIPGIADAATLGDGMDLGAIAAYSSYQQPTGTYESTYDVPVYAPAALPAPTSAAASGIDRDGYTLGDPYELGAFAYR